MDKIIVFDTESNGFKTKQKVKKNTFASEADRLWCIAAKCNKEEGYSFFGPDEIQEGLDYLGSCDMLVCHNLFDHDLPLIKKLYGWKPNPNTKLMDTLILSKLSCPDRNGGHSVEAWGERFGVPKPEHEDWTQFSDDMMHRCIEDVRIQVKIFQTVMKELKTGVIKHA